jgi:hypothetical protein
MFLPKDFLGSRFAGFPTRYGAAQILEKNTGF